MNVGELRKALEGVPDETEIVVRAWNEDHDADYCGTIDSAEVQASHDEENTPFFAVDCGPDEAEVDDLEFTCPKCGSHHFGSSVMDDQNRSLARQCHGEGCRFSFPQSDDAKYFGRARR